MIRVKIRPKGIMKILIPPGRVALKNGATVGDLTGMLGLNGRIRVIVVARGRRMAPDERLADGEEVTLISLLSGG